MKYAIKINFDDVKDMDLDEVEDAMLEQQIDAKSIEAQIEWQEITNQDVDTEWLARCRKALKWKETYLMVLGKRKKQLRRLATRERNDNFEALLLELFMREADQNLVDKLVARAEHAYPRIDEDDYRIQNTGCCQLTTKHQGYDSKGRGMNNWISIYRQKPRDGQIVKSRKSGEEGYHGHTEFNLNDCSFRTYEDLRNRYKIVFWKHDEWMPNN